MEPKDIKLAKKLATLVAAKGEAVLPELKPAFEKLLTGKSIGQRRSFVKAFTKFLKRELAKSELTVEHAGPISDAEVQAIVDALQPAAPRPLTVTKRENPALLAGIRATLGDNVFDASAAARLDTLKLAVR